ncbi:MAG: nuclear transport factor 2 family protein [Candidatus Aminicenantales bacterium]
MKKKDLLAGMKSGRSKPDSVEVGDLRVLVFGEFAVVNGRGLVKETLRGKEVIEKFRFVDTFQKQDGTWKAVGAFLVSEK